MTLLISAFVPGTETLRFILFDESPILRTPMGNEAALFFFIKPTMMIDFFFSSQEMSGNSTNTHSSSEAQREEAKVARKYARFSTIP
jgi:hypothetical protein